MASITTEKGTVERMIRLFCRVKRHRRGGSALCGECRDLLAYAHARLDRCPYGDLKPACRHCTIHCYKPEMRARIRRTMRVAGPLMLFVRPVQWLTHTFGRTS